MRREVFARTLGTVRTLGTIAALTVATGQNRRQFQVQLFDADGHEERIQCRRLIVADGVRSQLGRVLGRQWHRDTVFGVAARAYVASARHDDPWITSHLELRDEAQQLLSGYGWIFPLGDGHVNIGVGTLATQRRPADVKLREVLNLYVAQQRDEWQINEHIRMYASAMLPMGGAVSNVSGTNWMLIGDAAACVNPLNGEGIDYAYETARMAAQVLHEALVSNDPAVLQQYPRLLDAEFGDYFKVARLFARVIGRPVLMRELTRVGMHSRTLMEWVLRIMANLLRPDEIGPAEAA